MRHLVAVMLFCLFVCSCVSNLTPEERQRLREASNAMSQTGANILNQDAIRQQRQADRANQMMLQQQQQMWQQQENQRMMWQLQQMQNR